MTTLEIEREKTIVELKKFKKEFPIGFKGIFGHDTDTIKEEIKTTIKGLMAPVTNEINSTVADMLADSGIIKIFEGLATAISDLTSSWDDEALDDLSPWITKIVNILLEIQSWSMIHIPIISDLIEAFLALEPGTPSDSADRDQITIIQTPGINVGTITIGGLTITGAGNLFDYGSDLVNLDVGSITMGNLIMLNMGNLFDFGAF